MARKVFDEFWNDVETRDKELKRSTKVIVSMKTSFNARRIKTKYPLKAAWSTHLSSETLQALKAGWVHKNGASKFGGTKKRYAILTNEKKLYYFEDFKGIKLKGIIDLEMMDGGSPPIEMAPGKEGKNGWFQICTPTRTWKIKAEDEHSACGWVESLNECVGVRFVCTGAGPKKVPSDEAPRKKRNSSKFRLGDIRYSERRKNSDEAYFEQWLEHDVKVPEYLPIFEKKGYDRMSVAVLVTDKQLQEWGIQKQGHRIDILQNLQRYRQTISEPRTDEHCHSCQEHPPGERPSSHVV